MRNIWAYVVILCGHFADGAEKFTGDILENEIENRVVSTTDVGRRELRRRPVMAFTSGNLCYQIEHHLFPDLPSNRYAEIAKRVRALCDNYDLPYTTGHLVRQYLLTVRTMFKLALPDNLLRATSDDAPETASERKFWAGAGSGVECDRRATARPAHGAAPRSGPSPKPATRQDHRPLGAVAPLAAV